MFFNLAKKHIKKLRSFLATEQKAAYLFFTYGLRRYVDW